MKAIRPFVLGVVFLATAATVARAQGTTQTTAPKPAPPASGAQASQQTPPQTPPPTVRETVVVSASRVEQQLVNAPATLTPGQQFVVVAKTAPDAGCRFELRDDDGVKIDSIRTIADGAGTVFWLITLPPEMEGTPATVVVGCGGARDRIAIPVSA